MKRITYAIVFSALLVTAPRLMLAFLIGDGVTIPSNIEVTILAITGVGSGLVLTVGNAVLAHALAQKAHQRGLLWWIEAVAWGAFLFGAVVLVSPTLVAGLQRSTLGSALGQGFGQWLWAITAVVIVEVLVAAAMAATILTDEDISKPVQRTRQPGAWSVLTNAVAKRIEAGAPSVSRPALPATENGVVTPVDMVKKVSAGQRQEQILSKLRDIIDPNDIDTEALASEHDVTSRTIRRDISALVQANKLELNGKVKVTNA